MFKIGLQKTKIQATVAQLVEQLICNQLVGGSSPSSGSIFFSDYLEK